VELLQVAVIDGAHPKPVQPGYFRLVVNNITKTEQNVSALQFIFGHVDGSNYTITKSGVGVNFNSHNNILLLFQFADKCFLVILKFDSLKLIFDNIMQQRFNIFSR